MTSDIEVESSDHEEKVESRLSETDELFAKGKRHLICKEIQDALSVFAELCEKLAEKHGQTADELAEPYLYYGKALLEMARLENGILGHAFKEGPPLGEGGDDEDTDKGSAIEDDGDLPKEKREELRKDVEHAMREGNLYNDASTEEEIETEDECEVEKSCAEPVVAGKMEEEATSTAGSSTEKVTSKNDVEDRDTDDDSDKENEANDPEDVTNMQLAWEMFELASSIYKRSETLECKSKFAEAKHELGQIGLETEHYEQAVGDFEEALDIQKQIYDADDRRIAESCYNIGLAFSFDKKFAESILWFKKAVDVLDSRIKNLELKISCAEKDGGKEKASAELDEWTREVNELKDLVMLDLMSKIEDATESKKQVDESLRTMKEMAKDILGTTHGFDSGFDAPDSSDAGSGRASLGFQSGFDAPSGHSDSFSESAGAAVHDITSMVRKRKHAEEESATDVKKAKSTENGQAENGQVPITRAEA